MAETDKRLGVALAAATCALLGSGKSVPAAAADDQDKWAIESALLYYGESDDRVQDASLSVLAKRDFDDGKSLDFSITADTLTGASPSGAIALDGPQTFTSPSGNKVYTTPAGEIPLDDTFLDTRYAVSANWTQPFAGLYTVSAGASFSDEYDYTHAGVNLGLTRDFNQRNTTLSAALAYSQDESDPVGGTPDGLSQMQDVDDLSNRSGPETKDIVDVVIGVAQVINRTTVVRVNYSYSDSSGYLNDPYKFLSVVDPVTGDTIARTPPPGGIGPSGIYRFENRPDSRTKHGLYAEARTWLGGKVLNVSYRYMTDDWEIDSHTLEARLRWPIGGKSYVEPHLRYYTQTAAEFYRMSLVDGEPLPQYASADYRLADFDGITAGVKFGHETPDGNEFSVRLEYYQQKGNVSDSLLIGNQFAREASADLNAIVAQFSYRFRF
jgi:hypothetical protein